MFGSYRSTLVFCGNPLKNCVIGFHTCLKNQQQIQHPFKIKNKKFLEKQQNILSNINFSNQHELLADMVTPHWKISYEDELAVKQKMCEDILSKVLHKMSLKKKHDMQITIENIIPSPVRNSYRNKDEFSVWPGVDGNPKTVGFFIGSPAVGKVVCVPPTHIKCVKESHKEICQLYQDYIRSSPLAVSYQLYDGGFWRNIVIRSNDSGDHMAVVITHPGDFGPEVITEQEQLLQEYFNQHAPNLSLFHQSCRHVKCTREQAPIRHLSGKSHLMETMSNLTFRISPDSFFQLNKPAAEVMFKKVLHLLRPKHYTTLLDLYCGTGCISLLANERVRGCVGVEEVEIAVQDAAYNAKLNNIHNCTFVSGRVEMKLQSVLNKLDSSSELMVVVNPGRGGAAEGIISLLRQNRHIQRVVYISCKPDNDLTMKNFVQLCERVGTESKSFKLTKAVPVDMFPYTSHCELLLCFDKT